MSTSGQFLKFDDIRKEVAALRGLGRDIDAWDAQGIAWIEGALTRGYNMFLSGSSYDWSFLKPLTDLTIVEGTEDLVLPQEFAFLDGDIYFTGDFFGCPLVVENDARVLRRRNSATTTTGRPQYACITANKPGVAQGQRQILSFWPTADQDYDIALRYSILADALSTSNPYPYGGQAHSNTILEACLAASEQMDGQLGIHTTLYAMSLAGSKDYDRKVKSQTIGQENRRRRPSRYGNVVTQNSGFYLE